MKVLLGSSCVKCERCSVGIISKHRFHYANLSDTSENTRRCSVGIIKPVWYIDSSSALSREQHDGVSL